MKQWFKPAVLCLALAAAGFFGYRWYGDRQLDTARQAALAAAKQTTVNFVSLTGWAYCSEASVCSEPPEESVAVTDFNPVPGSLTTISMGAGPSTSESGVSRTCGGSRSKRGHRSAIVTTRYGRGRISGSSPTRPRPKTVVNWWPESPAGFVMG